MCFPIRHGKRLGETLKLWRLESLGSFKVSASVSEAATSLLGLGDMGLRSRLGLGSEGLVHIPAYSVLNSSTLSMIGVGSVMRLADILPPGDSGEVMCVFS